MQRLNLGSYHQSYKLEEVENIVLLTSATLNAGMKKKNQNVAFCALK